MNRNRHRVVFNTARGQFMVASETANSDSGASTTSSPERPARRNKLLLAALLVFCGPLWAQIVADPSAPGNQRATILQTANGVPLVNIQTPSAAGVSRNTYSRFDIDNRGAILNNSRTPVPTQLGGPTLGNPWINTPARVILNEVNSSNPTGGVLGGLNLNPTGLPTSGAGSQAFMTQLGQNLQAAAARAVIGTAINGGSLEDGLVEQLKTAFIDTFAAQGAHQIGDWTQTGALNDFTNKIAHAIAGCAIGAAKAASSGGCGAGALGAAIGELSAELYGTQVDTVQFASMMAGIASAMAGGDAAAINLASQTGANAAANNYLKHAERKQLKEAQKACYATGDAAACGVASALEYKDEMSDQLLANAAASCEGAECNDVSKYIQQQMSSLGCTAPSACPDYGTLGEYWKVAQAKAQGLEAVYPESWLLDAKLALDLGKFGIKLASGAVNTTKGSLDALGQLAKVDAKQIAAVDNKLYTDWPVTQDLIGYRITQLADRATNNPDAPLVVLGKYVPGNSSSYEQLARAKGATFFELPGNSWDNAVEQLGAERMWSINREFLDAQIAKGKIFEFTADPRLAKVDSFTGMEFAHLQSNGYRIVVDAKGAFYAVKK